MPFIYDLTPFSVVDYPGELAAIAWFAGCNMRCAYCYNPLIVNGSGTMGLDELKKFLASRQNRLTALVLSGGECTISPHFGAVLKEAKMLGFKTKVDTNGSNPAAILDNLDNINFVALDFKATKAKFKQITSGDYYDKFCETLSILTQKNTPFEVRTTVHADLLNEADISQMTDFLQKAGYKSSYFLQLFQNHPNLGHLTTPRTPFDPSKIRSNLKIIVRG